MRTHSFLQFLEFEKRYSKHTLTAYESDLNQFSDFLSITYQIKNISEVEAIHVRSWMVDLIDKKVATRSVNRKLSSLKSFFKFHLKRGDVEKNPMSKIQPPKSGKRLPVFVSKQHLKTLFEDITFPEGFEGVRDKLVLNIFYQTGVRVSELVQMKIFDFDFGTQKLRVFGKGKKERIIPFTYQFEKEVKEYLEVREIYHRNNPHTHLILNDNGCLLYTSPSPRD